MPPAYEVLLLNTAVPQIQAAQSGDTYVVPRDIAFSAALTLSAGTANGVPYLNGSKVLTTGSALTFSNGNFLVNGAASGSALSGDASVAAIRDSATANVASYKVIGGSSDTQIELFGSSSTTGLWTSTNTPMLFAVNNSEQMRLDSSGNLLVGTTSTANSRLIVAPASTADGIRIYSPDAAGSTYSLIAGFHSGPTLAINITTNGDVTNINNSYGAISDVKLKENIVDATPKLEKLNQVRVVNYNLIGEEQKQIGVIAQELEQIFPGMVDQAPDRDAEGNDLGTVTKSVKYSVFVPMLIKAMQEQQAIIEDIKTRLAAAGI